MTSIPSVALQRERQIMGIAMMSVDAIVQVNLSGGRVEILSPPSEIRRRQVQMLFGTTAIPSTLEDALADEEHERWAAYKARRCASDVSATRMPDIAEPIR